jgi:hypothetical protein
MWHGHPAHVPHGLEARATSIPGIPSFAFFACPLTLLCGAGPRGGLSRRQALTPTGARTALRETFGVLTLPAYLQRPLTWRPEGRMIPENKRRIRRKRWHGHPRPLRGEYSPPPSSREEGENAGFTRTGRLAHELTGGTPVPRSCLVCPQKIRRCA